MASLKVPSGGYDHDFVDIIATKYHCNICMKVLRDPRLTECCGQHYCDFCLKKWLKRNKTCPQCRKKDFQNILDKALIREIKEFKVRCTNKTKGCKWVGELGALKDHLESDNGCDYVMVICRNTAYNVMQRRSPLTKCGAAMERRLLADHQKNRCLYRQYTCQHCGYIDTYDAIAGSGEIRNGDSKIMYGGNHYSQCTQYPLDCPNKCGAENIKRKDIKRHRETCPMEPLNCPFQHVGCSVGKILRKDMDSHCKENMQTHLLLVVQSNQELAHKVDELTKTVETMNSSMKYGIATQDDGEKEGEEEGSVPDLNTQKDEIHALLNQKLKKGDTWYLVDVKWMKIWKKYVAYDQCDQSSSGLVPGPIDTSNLFSDGGEAGVLKEHLMEELDYSLVPEPAWNKLVAWYGISDTSRPIARIVVEYGLHMKHFKVEVYLLNFKLCIHPKLNEHVIKSFSRGDTISDLERELRHTFSIDQTAVCRVWHRYMSHTYELLNDSTQTLQDAGLYNMQTIVLECRKEDGTWPRSTRETSFAAAHSTRSKSPSTV